MNSTLLANIIQAFSVYSVADYYKLPTRDRVLFARRIHSAFRHDRSFSDFLKFLKKEGNSNALKLLVKIDNYDENPTAVFLKKLSFLAKVILIVLPNRYPQMEIVKFLELCESCGRLLQDGAIVILPNRREFNNSKFLETHRIVNAHFRMPRLMAQLSENTLPRRDDKPELLTFRIYLPHFSVVSSEDISITKIDDQALAEDLEKKLQQLLFKDARSVGPRTLLEDLKELDSKMRLLDRKRKDLRQAMSRDKPYAALGMSMATINLVTIFDPKIEKWLLEAIKDDNAQAGLFEYIKPRIEHNYAELIHSQSLDRVDEEVILAWKIVHSEEHTHIQN